MLDMEIEGLGSQLVTCPSPLMGSRRKKPHYSWNLFPASRATGFLYSPSVRLG